VAAAAASAVSRSTSNRWLTRLTRFSREGGDAVHVPLLPDTSPSPSGRDMSRPLSSTFSQRSLHKVWSRDLTGSADARSLCYACSGWIVRITRRTHPRPDVFEAFQPEAVFELWQKRAVPCEKLELALARIAVVLHHLFHGRDPCEIDLAASISYGMFTSPGQTALTDQISSMCLSVPRPVGLLYASSSPKRCSRALRQAES
jgi:hypothetical protein